MKYGYYMRQCESIPVFIFILFFLLAQGGLKRRFVAPFWRWREVVLGKKGKREKKGISSLYREKELLSMRGI